MRAVRTTLILSLLPLFAACQWLPGHETQDEVRIQDRMQGVLIAQGGQLLFQPCNQQRRYVVKDQGGTSILQQAADLAAKPGNLFADLGGRFNGGGAGDGQVDLQRLYRLERSNNACDDPNFKGTSLMAEGQSPHWILRASGRGMVLEREGQAPLALPYLEEQLPDGRLSLSSEANEQHIELWAAPQRCIDSKTGAVRHLTAELRINGAPLRGCAYFGGSRIN